MTRTQTRTYGVAISSSRQPLLAAMLRAFCWLVSNLVSLVGMTLKRPTRDWHTDAAREDHLPTANDKQQEAQHPQPSFSGKAAGRIPRTPVASTQGTTPYSHAPQNQDARHKAEHGSVDDPQLSPVIPAEARKREELEPRGDTRRHYTQLLGSRIRGNDDHAARENTDLI